MRHPHPGDSSLRCRAEGSGGATAFAFPVTLSAPSGRTVTVAYATADGTAGAGSDYAATAGTLTFVAGDVSEDVVVSVVADTTREPNETFTVTLSAAVNATISGGTGQGTIVNDDAVPGLSVSDVTVSEADAGTDDAVFTVTLNPASGETVTVDYATMAGTATAAADYATTAGTLTFAPGQVTRTVAVAVVADALDEPDETFTLALADPSGATLADASGTGTITDDDPPPALSVNDVATVEGATGATTAATFTIALSGASGRTVSVSYATTAGTATAGADYTGVGPTAVTFLAGEVTKEVSVDVLGDDADEPDETFTVNLSSATNASVADATGVGTITDDDAGPTFSVGDAFVTELDGPGATLVFTVTKTGTTAETVTVPYATADGTATAGEDYTAAAGTLSFGPADTTRQITVAVTGDEVAEPDETVRVNLGAPSSGTVVDGEGVGTIQDDEGSPPTLSIGDEVVVEGTGGTTTATFTVTRSGPLAGQVSVDYATVEGSAADGGDYTGTAAGNVVIPSGETSATIAVVVNPDDTDEPTESFTVVLSGARNAAIADGVATGTITDDDDPPVITVAATSVTEGSGGQSAALSFTVSLSNPSSSAVSAAYATSDGTAGAGRDYTARSGTVTLAPGQTSGTVTVTVVGDDVSEADETVLLTLSAPSGGTLGGTNPATGTIADDDPLPAASIGDVTVDEATAGPAGTTGAVFTVTLSAASGQAVSVEAGTGDGTASAPGDYAAVAGLVVAFAPGETIKTVEVTVQGDAVDEVDEGFSVTLTSPVNATVAAGTATGTITDDDAPPSLSIGGATTVEGSSGTTPATFTITKTGATEKAVTVAVATSDGTAVAPGDYAAVAGRVVTLAAGEATGTFSVSVEADTVHEANETFTVNLSEPTNATVADGTATGTIVDDDTPAPAPAPTPPPPAAQGYSLVGEDGSLYAFGSARNLGDMRGRPLNAPVIGVAYTPGGNGYWLVAADGGIFTFGDATFLGSMGSTRLNAPVIGMAATPTGRGYWLFAGDGGIFTFGDAAFFGSMGDQRLNAPVINMEPLASGNGYWLVAADGGIFTFGQARFFGSMGDQRINQPVFDMTSTDTDQGYWLVARDGGIFSFGDAGPKFFGSAVNEAVRPTRVVGMDSTPGSLGYWIADATGKVYPYGDAQWLGDRYTAGDPAPMIGFASVPSR